MQQFSVKGFIEDEIKSIRSNIFYIRMEGLMICLLMALYGAIIAFTKQYNYYSGVVILSMLMIIGVLIAHYVVATRTKYKALGFYEKILDVYARHGKL